MDGGCTAYNIAIIQETICLPQKGGISMTCSVCGKEGTYMISIKGMKELDYDSTYLDLEGDICGKCFIEKKGLKKLYHISLDLDVHYLSPRVPESRNADEDSIIPRISTSATIEGCLSAVPWGGLQFEDIFSNSGSPAIKVLEYDVDDIGYENIAPSDYLYQQDLVRDAFETEEFWITKEVEPSRSFYIVVDSYDEDTADYYSYSDFIDYYEGRIESDDLINGSFTTIENIKVTTFDTWFDCEYEVGVRLFVKPKFENTDDHARSITWALEEMMIEGCFDGDIDSLGDGYTILGTIHNFEFLYHVDTVKKKTIEHLSYFYEVTEISDEELNEVAGCLIANKQK